ncbi:hypothetical protein GQ53DRAFT_202099 [Thozetella sp. PMI_491]|nr:hypothetical protein GQ53DRAFT_202099 [Thozetella sp. PMI_491]
MNRFRNKKKGKDDGDDSSSGFFRRNKKSAEEPKLEINLDTALPSEDDFRTSLLMTNLSARFSMLREQDDPNTKIGKASDDSVLFPKRQSRMMDYGFSGGLHDIAEVESIKAPPSFTRMDSFASDSDSTKGGSIMDRARPNEGNNLFGGRQKIYKIAPGGGMGGRALYDDDVANSSFQRWRQAEREGRTLEEFTADEPPRYTSVRNRDTLFFCKLTFLYTFVEYVLLFSSTFFSTFLQCRPSMTGKKFVTDGIV